MPKVVIVGKTRSEKSSSPIRKALRTMDPENLPLRLLLDVYVYTQDQKFRLNKKMLRDPVTVDQVSKAVESVYSSEPITKVEICVDLDILEEEIEYVTKSFLSNYFK
jgi:hypothetical protein